MILDVGEISVTWGALFFALSSRKPVCPAASHQEGDSERPKASELRIALPG